MSVQHAIVVFPDFNFAEQLEAVRSRFDPLAVLLDAHVTLVFPFEELVDDAVFREHLVAAAAGVAPFEITLAAPTSEDDGYLFLRVLGGCERVVDLHRRLYSGLLAKHRSNTLAYHPHVTIGRLASPVQLALAAEEARRWLLPPLSGRIDSVALFRLDGPASGVIATVPLGVRTWRADWREHGA